jgi:hypothetical protein
VTCWAKEVRSKEARKGKGKRGKELLIPSKIGTMFLGYPIRSPIISLINCPGPM